MGYQPATGRLESISPLANGEAVSFGYHATSGQLSSIANPTVTLGYTFDGILPKTETVTGALTGAIARTYDNNFRVTGVAVNGANAALVYDRDDLIKQVGSLVIDRNASTGFITGTSLGTVLTTQDYNTFGELASFGVSVAFTNQYQYTLTYDKLGRISKKVETIAGVATTVDYGFDLAGRLETVKHNGVEVRRFGYDANGNRTHLNGARIGTYDDQDRMLSYGAALYQYGANGELWLKTEGASTTSYQFDVYGNLKQVTLPDNTQIEYLTDGRNRRIGKKVNGAIAQKFLYQDQLKIAAELDAYDILVSRFHYGTKINVPEYMEKGGQKYRIVTDHLGSVRLVINSATGVIAQRLDFDEWGNVLLDTNPGFQPFGYAGGVLDNHTKLTRFGARDYDAVTGRWTAKDPIGFEGGGTNQFGYAGNDPINYIDPSGLMEIYRDGTVSFHSYPGPQAGGIEHARHGPGENYHIHIKDGAGREARISTETWKPLTPDDQRVFDRSKSIQGACERLTEGEKKLFDRMNRQIFHRGAPTINQILRIGEVSGIRRGGPGVSRGGND